MKVYMKDYKKRYMGRIIKVFLNGGWAFTGVLELEMCDDHSMVLNSAGRLYEIPVSKISTVLLNADMPAVPTEEKISRTEPQEPSRYDNNPGGVVARPPKKVDALLEEYIKNGVGQENHYGSIIPDDLLVGDGDEGTSKQVDFPMSFTDTRNPEQAPQQWEMEEEGDGSE